MALFKTSSFAENAVKLRHDNHQESLVLDKKINLMKSIEKQSSNNLGLDSKMIAKRLKDNLQRSSQTSAKIGKIKSGMPATASEHYKEEKFGVVQALKEVWNEDESKGKVLAFANEVTIPAAIHLLHANGFQVEKHVTDKLEDLRKSQQRLQRISKSSCKTRAKPPVGYRRRSSLPNLPLEALTDTKKEDVRSREAKKEVKVTTQLVTDRKHPRPRHNSASSTSTSSSGVIHRKVQRMRSQTQPNIFAMEKVKSRSTKVYTAPGNRPTSAPNQEKEIKVKPSTVAWVEKTSANPPVDCRDFAADYPIETENFPRSENHFHSSPEKSKEQMEKEKECSNSSSDDEDLITYGVHSTSGCPLKELHNKIHTRMEDVTLIDLHRASVVSKNYPGRMKSITKDLKGYKLPKQGKSGISGDYYSYRMLKERKTAIGEGTGRRAVSATRRDRCMVTSLPSSASRCSSEEESETEDEYFRYMKRSFERNRNQSLTMRTVSTVWGPSEFIEFVA